ncbi:MAG: ArsI/CadI family heavy metal resistance metalloenzyme [Pacificimonas sp.]
MKRIHIHVGVEDIATSTAFYSAMFGSAPTKEEADYAKWQLDDPRVNFAISSDHHAANGVEHLGIEVESAAELADVYARLEEAGRPVIDEGSTQCCYAKSEKHWVTDPDGVIWETFHTTGDHTSYGEDAGLAKALEAGKGASCC